MNWLTKKGIIAYSWIFLVFYVIIYRSGFFLEPALLMVKVNQLVQISWAIGPPLRLLFQKSQVMFMLP